MKKNKENNNNELKRRIGIEFTDVLIFAIVFVIYTLALLSFFPGLVTSDLVDQINQAQINEYSNAHPIFHSFVIGNLTKLGGIWVPALFQILVFAIIWTYLCKTVRKYNSSISNRIFQIIFTFVIAVLPLNFLYSITLWKDILYSYSFLILLIYLYIGVKENFKFNILQDIFIAISTIAIMKFRHNGVPIGIIMFAIITIMNFVKNKKIKETAKLLVSFVLVFIIMSLPQWTVKLNKSPASVGGVLNSTKLYCMGALLNSDINLENDEEEFLNTIMNVDEWRECYSPYDGTTLLFNKDLNSDVLSTEEGLNRFDEIFWKYTKQKPGEIIMHFIKVNSIWWSVPELGSMHSIIINNGSVSEMSGGIYDNHPIWMGGNNRLGNYAIKTLENKVLYTLIYRPAVAVLVSIIAIIAVCVKEKRKGYLLILLPMILNIGTYVFLMSSQDQRYFYPCFMTEYASVIIFAATFIKNKKKKAKKENKINENETKTLIIVPAYNEEQSIEKVVNNVYRQQIDNCDVLVVNDGSTDDTLERAKNTKAIVIDSVNNLGIGGAVQTGYLYAYKYNYDVAIQIDGDGQHDPKYIKQLIEEIKNGNDLVIGSRFIEKKKYKQTFFRMLGINLISFTIKRMTKVKIYDTTSGYRAANKNVIREFVDYYPYDYPEPITNMYIIKNGYKVKEIPVEMKKRETGQSSISALKSISYMFKVILSILLGGLKE